MICSTWLEQSIAGSHAMCSVQKRLFSQDVERAAACCRPQILRCPMMHGLGCRELNRARALVAKVSDMFHRRDPMRAYMDDIVAMSTQLGNAPPPTPAAGLSQMLSDIMGMPGAHVWGPQYDPAIVAPSAHTPCQMRLRRSDCISTHTGSKLCWPVQPCFSLLSLSHTLGMPSLGAA